MRHFLAGCFMTCMICTASAVRSGCVQPGQSALRFQVFSREFLSLAVNCRILSFPPKPIVTNHTAFLEWSQSAEVRPRPACAEP